MILIIGFCFLFLKTNALWGAEEALPLQEGSNEKIEAFLNELSREQKDILEKFFRLVIKDHLSGYVLFGDKPICIEGYPLEKGIELHGVNQANTYAKWMKLWHELKVLPENKNYCFIDFDAFEDYHHILCINRQAFLQTVNDHLHLFRYVLGPTLTADKLLEELIQAKERFYDVLKDDNVLLGILLGYGTENALLVSREEFIIDAFAKDCKEDFPFIAKKIRFKQTKLPNMQFKRPSLGFDSLEDESSAIKEITTTSSCLKSFEYCRIPHFGCNPDSPETQELLAKYEVNRSTILQILRSEDFLEETLKKLFTTTYQGLEIPKVPVVELKDKEENDISVADFLYKEINSKEYFHESYIEACLEGMEDCQNGNYVSQFYEDPNRFSMAMEMFETAKDLKGTKNLEKSDGYFNDLDSEKGFIALIPKKVYYKVIKKGVGPSLSIKAKNVSFHHSCYILDKDTPSYAGTVKEESIEHFIPGIGIALMGMKKGEEREVHIHPEYGYGENAYLEPNVTIIAKIELLDFSKGAVEVTFFPSYALERKNFQELLAKYRKLSCKESYDEGALFINSMKKSKVIDPKDIQKCFDRLQNSITSCQGAEEQYQKCL